MTTQTRPWHGTTDCVPALESGDRLTREEFHRRYLLRPDIHKAELVKGVVYVPSPVRMPEHGAPHALLIEELGFYRRQTPHVTAGDNTTLILPDGSEVQPDVMLRRRRGGSSRVNTDHFVVGAPELVAEISASSASYDLHDKKDAYRDAGVPEYIVWRVEDEAIDWWELKDGQYVPIPADADGLTRSRVFPGLALDRPGLLAAARAMREEDLAEDQTAPGATPS